MHYGLLEAVVYYYYYYYLKNSVFDKKFGKFFFFNYVYIGLIFWENFANFFVRKLKKNKKQKNS